MAWRGSISRTFMSTAARSSSFRLTPLLPRIRPTPMSTAQSLLPLAGSRMTSHLIVDMRAFCNLSQGPDSGIKSDQTREKFQADTSHASSTVNDPIESKTPEASQTLRMVLMIGLISLIGFLLLLDPEVVKSSTKKKTKNRESYPQFDLNDPLASDSDRQIMNMLNEYNRRNHAIIAEQKPMEDGERVSDEQLENLGELLKSLSRMFGDDVKVEIVDDNNNSSYRN